MCKTEVAELDLAPPRLDHSHRPPMEALKKAATCWPRPAIRPSRGEPAGPSPTPWARRSAWPSCSRPARPQRVGHRHTAGVGFPADHPLYGQGLPLDPKSTAQRVRRRARGRHGLAAAVCPLRAVAAGPSCAVSADLQNPWQLGKNYPGRGRADRDCKSGLAELPRLAAVMPAAQQARPGARRARTAAP